MWQGDVRMNELGVVKYGDREIAYAVEFCRRKTLEISVMPDSAVQIRAPQGATLDAIAQKVQKKASWIVEKQDWFAKFSKVPPPKQYLGGVKKLLDEWLRNKAKAQFKKIFDDCIKKYAKSVAPRLQIRDMKTRWGSLSKGGILTLNIKLIAAPKECIEYVVVHELCHLKYPNHDSKFYRLLDTRLPDWERRKNKLENLQV